MFDLEQNVSYKVIANFTDGKSTQFNYVDEITYGEFGTVLLKGNEQATDGSMIRRDFVIERANVKSLEARVIRK